MPISIIHEDDADLSLNQSCGADQVLEDCHFCSKPTRFWHVGSNTPVCPGCAKTLTAKDLPQRLRFVDPAYRVKRKMSAKQIRLREQDDDLEQYAIRLAGDRSRVKELSHVQRQRQKIQRMMILEGLPVLRPVIVEPGTHFNQTISYSEESDAHAINRS